MKIQREHLTPLLNALYDNGERRVKITHPVNEIGDLATINLEDQGRAEIEFELDTDSYIDARNKVELDHGELVKEIPKFQDYIKCYLATGIIDLDNHSDVLEFLEREGRADLQEGHEPVWMGIDTNLVPWRLHHILQLDPSVSDRPIVNGFALAEGIRRELDWDKKVSKDKQRGLTDAFGEEYEEFLNQPKDWRRIGRQGLAMYREMKNHSYGTEIPGESGDEGIIKSYEEFKESGHRQVVLLSEDDGFTERAKASRIPAKRVESPRELPKSVETNWVNISDLIYMLGVIFGVIELPKTTVHGIWRGKKGEDWNHEYLEVRARSPKIEKPLRRDIELLEIYSKYA